MKKEYILSIIAIIVSVIALCVVCVRNSALDIDWYGALIGVLSLLVTVLIGWNIYTMIDANRFKEDIRRDIGILEEKHEEMKRAFRNEVIATKATLFDSVSLPYKKVEGNHDDFLYTFFTIQSIGTYSLIGDIDAAITRMDDLLEVIPTYSPIENEDKSFLISLIEKEESVKSKEYHEKLDLLRLALLKWGSHGD